jgi:hypothetical protein
MQFGSPTAAQGRLWAMWQERARVAHCSGWQWRGVARSCVGHGLPGKLATGAAG